MTKRQLFAISLSVVVLAFCLAWQTPVIGPNSGSGGITVCASNGYCATFAPQSTMTFSPLYDTSSYLNFTKSIFATFSVNGTVLNTNSAAPNYSSILTPDPTYTICPPVVSGNNFGIECLTPSAPGSFMAAPGQGFQMFTASVGTGSSTKFNSVGDILTSLGTDTGVAATATIPALTSSASGATSGNCAGWTGANNARPASLPINISYIAYPNASDLTSARIYVGLGRGLSCANLNTADATNGGSGPTGITQMAMINYSTVRGDSTYQCVTTNNGTTYSVVAITGATPASGAGAAFEIDVNSSSVVCRVGANSVTVSSNVPTTNPMGWGAINITQQNAATHIEFGQTATRYQSGGY